MWGKWTVSSTGKRWKLPEWGSADELPWIGCDNSIVSPFASTERPRMPVGRVASIHSFSLFQFYVWLSTLKCLLVVWALQMLRVWKAEWSCQRWNLKILLILVNLDRIGLHHVQIQNIIIFPLCKALVVRPAMFEPVNCVTRSLEINRPSKEK